MRRLAAFAMLLTGAALVSACNGSGGSSQIYTPGGGGSPSPSLSPTFEACPAPTNGSAIIASPNPLHVNVTANAVLTICEQGYLGSFSVQSNSQSCIVSPLPVSGSWNVFGSFAGTCILTIKDNKSNILQVPATVG